MIDLENKPAISPSAESLRNHFGIINSGNSTVLIKNDDSLSFQALHQKTNERAAVLIPIIPAREGLQVLLTRRAEHLRYHPGEISFPGGRIEDFDRSAIETATREAHEEIGLPSDKVEVLGELGGYFTLHGVCITPVVALVKEPIELIADPNEVSDIFQVPLNFLLDPSVYDTRSHQHKGTVRNYYSAFYQQRHIWGVTAGIIMGLYEELLGTHL
jgi:8-oxo-dGTP pyrophosphatase MutT (NUDIX family)